MLISSSFLAFFAAAYGVAIPYGDLRLKDTDDSMLYSHANTVDKAFIIELGEEISTSPSSEDRHGIFHKRAASISYDIRHEFNSTVFTGVSISVKEPGTDKELQQQLLDIPGVTGVWPVYKVPRPGRFSNLTYTESSGADVPFVQKRQSTEAQADSLASALELGGVDRLHAKGIKGKGIKVGIIDTGVDYRHPALGGGFGPGFKVAGGYSFVNDNGTLTNSPDPLSTCITGGHGTHVSGKNASLKLLSKVELTSIRHPRNEHNIWKWLFSNQRCCS